MHAWAAINHIIRGAVARLWYRALRHMPVPSEHKWRGTEELFALVSQAALEADKYKRARHLMALESAMEQSGANWMRRRSEWLKGSPGQLSAVADLMVLVFKTLNMPARVKANGSTIQAVTFRCPFVEQAKNTAMARRTCQVVCSRQRSLFHGFVAGLPVPVDYSAPQKMGWGDSQCVKEFRANFPLEDARSARRRALASRPTQSQDDVPQPTPAASPPL